VDLAFREVDETEDDRFRRLAWDAYVAGLYAREDPLLKRLDELGLQVGQLREAFLDFARYPDVEDWPAPEPESFDLDAVRAELLRYIEHMERLPYPPDTGTDALMPRYRLVARLGRLGDLRDENYLFTVLEQCTGAAITQKYWPGKDGKARAKAEKARWDDFRERFVEPALRRRRNQRYPVVLEVLHGAREAYDRLRSEAGALNFQDLLLRAAALLRDNPAHVREYFARRFTHLLVDEFQDTDPIQAEVMCLLTADDPRERDWRTCRPRPGALFVVGDPKQSIYRFRRADIVTYNRVRDLLARHGRVVRLSANFRSVARLREWVNRAFEGAFPAEPDVYSPEYVPLAPGRPDEGDGACVQPLETPPPLMRQDDIAAWEADVIARAIRRALDRREPVFRRDGTATPARPGDFLILTRQKKRLAVYARALQDLGIPHQVAGGAALNETPEVELLHLAVSAAVNPHDPVAVVAALRSELFGLSDRTLYAFRKHGGEFRPGAEAPAALPPEERKVLDDALGRLARYRRWIAAGPPVAAIERMIADLGLWARAGAATGGDVRSGSLAKAVELIRSAQSGTWTAGELAEYLAGLAASEEEHDAVPVLPHEAEPVRVMNLHKAKGLEGEVVFLADPSGAWAPPPRLHVDRSGDRARGFMAVYGERRGNQPVPLLACPVGWEAWAEEEERFEKAESARLLYVAATRAASRLIVSRRAKESARNPWAPLRPFLEDCPPLEDPGPVHPQPAETQVLLPADVEEAHAELAARWGAAAGPTYSVEAAKEISVARPAPLTGGEHGVEWGKVVHLVLETLMRSPGADVRGVTLAVLDDLDLPAALADEVGRTVEAVLASDLWRRARAAERCLVEAPFCVCLKAGHVVRGVVDLAFREGGEWVIVDYKTGAADAAHVSALARRYAGQVETYAEAWRRCVGERVKEVGIFFTGPRRYEARSVAG